MNRFPTPNHYPPLLGHLCTGIDVGGTKIHTIDSGSNTVLAYKTSDFADMDEVLETYFAARNARPARIMIGMAGPRNDVTGEVTLTNADWPTFSPVAASQKYGLPIDTENDMVVTAAGIEKLQPVDFLQIKPGAAVDKGTKLVAAVSTGIGVGVIVWDKKHQENMYVASEGGHAALQPRTMQEYAYMKRLQAKYPLATTELGLSGKHGVDNLIDSYLPKIRAAKLRQSVKHARVSGAPVGTVLLEYALHGTNSNQKVAQLALTQMGNMLGGALRDLAVTFKATGGVYLPGSVATHLGEYFANNTEFIARFITDGATHSEWLTQTPIYIVQNPDVAVIGALSLAQNYR